MARHLHRFARRVVKRGAGARERDAEALERLHDLDAGAVLFPRAVAQIDHDVEAHPGNFSHLADGRGHGRNGAQGIGAGAHRKAHPERAPRLGGRRNHLIQRPVHRRHGPGLVQRIQFHIPDDSHDFADLIWEKGQREMFSERVLIGPKALGHGFTDERDGSSANHVGVADVASAQQRDAQRAQVA